MSGTAARSSDYTLVADDFRRSTPKRPRLPDRYFGIVGRKIFRTAKELSDARLEEQYYSKLVKIDPPDSIEARLIILRAELETCLASKASQLSPATYNGILRQITRRLDAADWKDGDELPRLSSFRIFVDYVASIRFVKCPSIGIADNGNFLAAWSGGAEGQMTVEFQSDAVARWTVVRFGAPNGTITGAGRCPTGQLNKFMAPFATDRWQAEQLAGAV